MNNVGDAGQVKFSLLSVARSRREEDMLVRTTRIGQD